VAMEICRQPSTPLHESVDPSKATYIQSLRENEGLFRFANLQSFRGDGRRLWEVVFRRYGGSLSSDPVRYGYILYSLFKQKIGIHDDSSSTPYLSLFYNSTHEAIERKEFESVVYGCFAGCMYSLRAGRNFQEVKGHARGFLISVSNFSTFETEEKFLLECMTEKMLWEAGQRFLFKTNWSTSDLSQEIEFLEAFFLSWKLKENEPLWMKKSSSEVKLKLKFVKTFIQLYRCHHRFNNIEGIKESLFSRFYRDFATPIETYTPYDNSGYLRALSRALWSRLLDIVLDLASKSGSAEMFDQRSETTILAIHSIINHILEPRYTNEISRELGNLLEVASYCMVLVALNLDTLSAGSQIGTSCLSSKLMD
jgi:hypothetical protein